MHTPLVAHSNRIRLAIVSTHPIQYYAPVFRALAQSEAVVSRVFFTWSQTAEGPVFDPGFGTRFAWDIPMLEGYDHEFVPNVAKRPGSNHFFGIRNPELAARISAWGADAILVYAWNLHSHLSVLRHFKRKIPVLFRGDSTLLDPRSPLRALSRRLFLRWIYRHVDLAIAVGENNKDYFEWCGVDSDRIGFAPHSVDTRRFGDETQGYADQARKWRAELGIPDDEIVFLFAAKFQPLKEPLLLLDAFTELNSGAHLILVGNGQLETALHARAQGHANIHFLPFQNQADMPAVYRVGDIYVLPSNSETWGLAMNEAMASGRPVIASSRVGGARDLVQEGATGWCFESGQKNDLMRVLRSAIASGRAGLHAMGARAKVNSTRWSAEVSAEAIAAAVRRACGTLSGES